MSEHEIRLVGLFFFFTLLDDMKAVEAASQASDLYQLKIKRKQSTSGNVLLIQVIDEVWHKMRARFQRGRPHYSTNSGWVIPENIQMGPWKEFQKLSSEDELIAVTLNLILEFKEDEVASALGITTGTLRYRLGRALRKLGGLSNSLPKRMQVVRT